MSEKEASEQEPLRELYLAAKQVPWIAWATAAIVSVLVTLGAIELLPWTVMVKTLRNPDSLPNAVWVWLTVSLLLFILVNALYFLGTSVFPKSTVSAGTVFTTFWALAVAVLILLLIFSSPGTVSPEYGVFAAITGGVLGWLLGIGLTPEDTTERQTFASIQTRIVASVAGIAGISLKSAWDWFAVPANQSYRIYLAFALLSALVSLAAVYINRQSGSRGVRISFPDSSADAKNKQCASTKVSTTLQLTATATGFPDSSVVWEIVPGRDGANPKARVPNGSFIADEAGTYTVSARSNFDPNVVDTVVVGVAA